MIEHAGDLLSALLDGELDDGQATAVRAHLAACVVCARELDDVRIARRLLRQLPAVEPPADLAELGSGDAIAPDLARSRRQNEGMDAVVVPLRTRRQPRLLGAAAALVAVAAVGALLVGRSVDAGVDPDVDLAIEKHASTVGALEAEGVIDESAERLEADQPAPPTTAVVQPLSQLDEELWAPATLAGYELVEAYRSDEGVHLLYRRGVYGLSVIERRGELDEDALPEEGSEISIRGAQAWRSDDGRVLVLVLDEVVVTILADEPGTAAASAAVALLRDR